MSGTPPASTASPPEAGIPVVRPFRLLRSSACVSMRCGLRGMEYRDRIAWQAFQLRQSPSQRIGPAAFCASTCSEDPGFRESTTPPSSRKFPSLAVGLMPSARSLRSDRQRPQPASSQRNSKPQKEAPSRRRQQHPFSRSAERWPFRRFPRPCARCARRPRHTRQSAMTSILFLQISIARYTRPEAGSTYSRCARKRRHRESTISRAALAPMPIVAPARTRSRNDNGLRLPARDIAS